MEHLSNEIYLLILDYLYETDQIEWCGCKKKWYDEILRSNLRKLRITICEEIDEMKFSEQLEKIRRRSIILNPLTQLDVEEFSPTDNAGLFLNLLLPNISYAMNKLTLSSNNWDQVFPSRQDTGSISIKKLELRTLGVQEEQLTEFLRKVTFLQVLDLNMTACEYQLPHIQTLKQLIIRHSTFPHPIHLKYLSHLEVLNLYECDISDVRILGSIPDLTLYQCNLITDISALNHNRKVTILSCDLIIDFSHSFEYSEVITITSSSYSSYSIDFQKWKKVKILNLSIATPKISWKMKDIPMSVLQCSLSSTMVGEINLFFNSSHKLRSLLLSYNNSLLTVENKGFERLVAIELCYLTQLSSLKGLGLGKNQRVIINCCPGIKDYSPLRHVHEVKIFTKDSVRLDELDHVYTLTIDALDLIIDTTKSYKNIHELCLQRTKLSTFRGLANIPFISIDSEHIAVLKDFLEVERRLYNHRIDFTMFYNSDEPEVVEQIRSFYNEYLEPNYIFHGYLRGPSPQFYPNEYAVSLLRR